MKTFIININNFSSNVKSFTTKYHFFKISFFIKNERSINQFINNEFIFESMFERIDHIQTNAFIKNEQHQKMFMKNEQRIYEFQI